MPIFHISAWRIETLSAYKEYKVEANTLADAVRLLATAQQRANKDSQWIDLKTCEPSTARQRGYGLDTGIVVPLEPDTVVEAYNGYELLSMDGRYQYRSLCVDETGALIEETSQCASE